jgi:hypothetical protein
MLCIFILNQFNLKPIDGRIGMKAIEMIATYFIANDKREITLFDKLFLMRTTFIALFHGPLKFVCSLGNEE